MVGFVFCRSTSLVFALLFPMGASSCGIVVSEGASSVRCRRVDGVVDIRVCAVGTIQIL